MSDTLHITEKKEGLKIIRSINWLFFDKLIRILARLTTSVLVARYLGPSGYGLINYGLSITMILFSISELGLNGVVVNKLVNSKDHSKILSSVIVLRLSSSIFILLLAVGFSNLFLSNQQLVFILTLLSVGLCFKAFDVIDYWFQSITSAKYPVTARSVALLMASLAQLTLIFFEFPLLAFATAMASEFVITAILYIVFFFSSYPERFKFKPSLVTTIVLLKKSWPLILSSVSALLYLKVDQVMLGIFKGNQAVGEYAVAAQLSEVWYFLPSIITTSFFPRLIQDSNNEPKNNEFVYKLYCLMFTLAMALSLVVTIASPIIIPFIYGSNYKISAVILSIHIWASIFIFMRGVLSKWFIINNLLIFSLWTHGLGAVLNILLNLLLIPNFSGIGAAVSTVISYAVASYIALYFHSSIRSQGVLMTSVLFRPALSIKKAISLIHGKI